MLLSLVIFLCQVILLVGKESADLGLKLIDVQATPNNEVIKDFVNHGMAEIFSNKNGTTQLAIETSETNHVLDILRKKNIKFSIAVENILDLIKAEENYLNHKRTRRKREANEMDWTSYHNLEDIEGYLGWLNSTHGHLARVMPVARTEEGRLVYVVKVSDSSERRRKKKIWIEGGIHAREWISPAVTTFLLHQVVTSPEFLPLLQKADWYFVPVANPDGYAHSFKGGRARLWRKNRKRNNVMFPNLCKGVDLNRNWDLKWGVGASSNHCSETYKGTEPFSEKEARGLRDAMEYFAPIDLFITFHSYGQSVLYPWGWTTQPPKNVKSLAKMGMRFVEAVNHVSGKKTVYTLGSSAKYGLASGASDDWAFGAINSPFSYTIELRDNGMYGFLLPENQIFDTVKESAVGVYCMASYLTKTGLCSQPDFTTPHLEPRSDSYTISERIIFREKK